MYALFGDLRLADIHSYKAERAMSVGRTFHFSPTVSAMNTREKQNYLVYREGKEESWMTLGSLFIDPANPYEYEPMIVDSRYGRSTLDTLENVTDSVKGPDSR